jgi:hypothetical protein
VLDSRNGPAQSYEVNAKNKPFAHDITFADGTVVLLPRKTGGGYSFILWLLLSSVLAWPQSLWAGPISATARGATVETDRYRATIRDGALAGFLNKLTGEEYLKSDALPEDWRSNLPSGLGTQNTIVERTAAHLLFDWPWWEFANDTNWPNQHVSDSQSEFTFVARGAQAALLTYCGLGSGPQRFADETFTLEVRVDSGTGDLLITPGAESPRGGVYGSGFAVGTLAQAVTVEAPIFEGLRLDRQMQRKLYSNSWPGYWDYAFLALNGELTGAVGLWCQDAELKHYKSLFYRVSDAGLSLSVMGLNAPPFGQLKSAQPITWRMQAFDKSWAQAAARFRAWRLANVPIAPRAAWVTNLSFMNYGMNKVDVGGISMLRTYFSGLDLNRVITWAPAVRGAGFDQNHANNTPYDGCRSDMAAWKSSNLKVMAYLQPMIMWAPNPQTDRERDAVTFSARAITRSPFLADDNTSLPNRDQHNLWQPDWQRWFLDWVREYIQSYGFDGIYHDQTYHCPMDARGLVAGGMTSPQGMAQYFYRAATESPGTLHATEHLTEVNSVGASLGLGCGIIWGVPGYQGKIGPVGSMNWQRTKRASPVSNALPGPQSAIFGFPHQSNFTERGPGPFHHGMDQMEGRGDLAALPLGQSDFVGNPIAFTQAVNEIWLDRQRAVLFVQHGLRAVFPENWSREVFTYFHGADGTDFRYAVRPWGSAFVEVQSGQEALRYGRVNGVTRAAVAAGIFGWPCYDALGPVGLDTNVTYCLDPAIARPPGVFAPKDESVCVTDAFANGAFATLQLRSLAAGTGNFPGLRFSAAVEPKALWVDGVAVMPQPAGAQLWDVPAKTNSIVVAIFQEPPPGSIDPTTNGAVCRLVQATSRRDLLNPTAFKAGAAAQTGAVKLVPAGDLIGNRLSGQSECHLPLKAPANSRLQALRLTFSAATPAAWWNGQAVTWTATGGSPITYTANLPVKPSACGLLSLNVSASGVLKLDWIKAP